MYSMMPQLSLSRAQTGMSNSIERLSSGLAINSSFDNPSGFSISEKMRGYIEGLKTATQNTQNGTSMLQTAEGAANEITNILGRMRELAVQGANGTYTTNDLTEIQKEMDQLKEEIDRISEAAEYNTINLLNGDTAGELNSSTEKVEAVITGTIETGNYDISIKSEPGVNEIQKSQILSIKEGSIAAAIKSATGTNITSVSKPEGFDPQADLTVTVADSTDTNDYATINSQYTQDGSAFNVATTTSVSTNESGYYIVEFTETTGDEGLTATTTARVKFISAETGEEGAWKETTVGELVSTAGFTYQSGDFDMTLSLDITTGSSFIANKGDKVMLNVTDNKGVTAAATLAISGGGTIQLDNGPVVYYKEVNELTEPDNDNGVVESKPVVIYNVTLNGDNGGIDRSNLTVSLKENTPDGSTSPQGVTLTGTITVDIRGSGEAATETTELADIAAFYDENDVFMFQNTQELRIYGNYSYTDIFIEGHDTITDLQGKFNNAIVKDLGLGSGNTAVDNELVQFIEHSSEDLSIKATAGAFIVQSAVPGESGEISFIGSQEVLNALGFSAVQDSVNSITNVVVKDSETGVVISDSLTASERVSGVIEGLDLIIDQRLGVVSTFNDFTGKLEFDAQETIESQNIRLHVIDDRTEIQVGTEEGEKIDITIPQIDTKSLGIENTIIATQEDAQNAISEIDNAISIVIGIRGDIGANVNRMDVAYSILQESSINVTAAESRIRDIDIAEETTLYTAEQVKYEASMAILAQANQIPQKLLQLLQA